MIQIACEFQILFISGLISPALVGGEECKYMLGDRNTKKYTLKIEMTSSPFQFALYLDSNFFFFLKKVIWKIV